MHGDINTHYKKYLETIVKRHIHKLKTSLKRHAKCHLSNFIYIQIYIPSYIHEQDKQHPKLHTFNKVRADIQLHRYSNIIISFVCALDTY
jgi:hypothetical protein